MSSITSLSSTPTGLAAVNIHAHGRKRGSHVGATDDSGGGTTAVPATTQQNLFGGLLQSLQQTLGEQSSTAAPAAGSAAPITGVPASAGTAQSASALLQNYLNNSLQNPAAGGSQAAVTQSKLNYSV